MHPDLVRGQRRIEERCISGREVQRYGLRLSPSGGQVDPGVPALQRDSLQFGYDELPVTPFSVTGCRPHPLELGGRRVVATERTTGNGDAVRERDDQHATRWVEFLGGIGPQVGVLRLVGGSVTGAVLDR